MLSNIVREFTLAAADGDLPIAPQEMLDEDIDFIRRMVKDEMDELLIADNDVERIDALVDAVYYIFDFAARKGINLDPFIWAVHAANMRKLVNGRVIRETEDPERLGKINKPPGWNGPEDEMIMIYAEQEEGWVALRKIYLASPYTALLKETMHLRFTMVEAATAFLSAQMADSIYSPIVHFHQIAHKYQMPTDAKHWRQVNFVEIERSDVVFALRAEGWAESVGMRGELDYAKKIGRPIYWLTPTNWGTPQATFILEMAD